MQSFPVYPSLHSQTTTPFSQVQDSALGPHGQDLHAPNTFLLKSFVSR